MLVSQDLLDPEVSMEFLAFLERPVFQGLLVYRV